MASIYRDGKTGIWYINYINLNGKRVRKSLGTRDKKLAQLKLKEIEVELAKGRLGFTVNISLGEFLKKYLDWSKNTKSEWTYKTDKKAANVLLEYLGRNIKLSQITKQKIEGFKIFLVETKGYRKTSANVFIRHTKAMFNKAVEWQFLEKSPANISLYKTPIGRPDFLTEKEIKKLFKTAEKIDKKHLAMFALFYYTGMRLSEVSNLTWSDIDFENEIILVRSKDNWHTKNYKERHIPIHKKLLPHLEYLKNVSDSDKVVSYHQRTIHKIFEKYSKLLNIKLTPHILRHSIATAMSSKGVNPQAIQKILGHSSISTTMIYAKLTDEYIKKSLETVD